MLLYSEYNGVKKISGKGLSRVISGRGVAPHIGKVRFLYGGKFSINFDKLNKCVLHVYYTKSHVSLPSLKSEAISIDTRDVILDILHQRFNITRFNKLQPDEQRVILNFVRTTQIPDVNLTEFDEAYQRRFEVLRGEI